MRIAMWSGPRNLSTAMMYSFGARGDCAVWDEPFYAAYLARTGLDHPMRDAILCAGEQDAGRVARRCSGAVPDGKRVFYQKHMTHHMIPGIDQNWISEVVNVFLIRHPARVIASYNAKRENPTLEDLGFLQQVELMDKVQRDTGKAPIVIDSTDIRRNPAAMLRKLCATIGLPYQETMLHWPAGGHKNDGAWAPHWYGSVWKSTGFAGAEAPLPSLSGASLDLLHGAMPCYERMAAQKIVPAI